MGDARSSKPAQDRLRLPLLSDHAISKSDLTADHFGLERKLGAVVDAIELKASATPFAVMLTGGWGAGKTSAMCWLDATFQDHAQKATPENSCTVDTCWFYPWKYQNKEDVWRGLIAEVILRSMKIEGVDTAKIIKAARQFGGFLGQGFIRLLGSIKLKAGIAGAGAEVDSQDAIGGVLQEYGKNITPHEAYFNEFEHVFKSWVEETYPEKGNRRLVVFIDDLDRCLPDIALQVLEALKLYLHVPNLVFVVGVERSVIDRIVHKRYCDLVGKKTMESDFKNKAALYLDKMFTVEINVEPTDDEAEEFFVKRIESTPVWQSVPAEHQDRLKRVILALGGRTPRSIVRLVNRVVVACGRRPGSDGLVLAQELQRELLDAVCQQVGYEDLPQKHASGRRFFEEWSRILGNHPGPVIRFSAAELEARKANTNREYADSYHDLDLENPLSRLYMSRGSERATNANFDHLAPLLNLDFSNYHELLVNLNIARLLQIPYAAPESGARALALPAQGDVQLSDDQWAWLREVVALSEGVDPQAITIDDIRQLTTLQVFDDTESDFSPLAALTSLQQLLVYSDSITDISVISHLSTLETLGLRAPVNDLSPLAGLTALSQLSVFRTPVSDLSPLANLTSLASLTLLDTKVADLSPLVALKSLKGLAMFGGSLSDISPIARLSNLVELTLCGVPVTNLSPLARLPALQVLDLVDTNVADLSPIRNISALKQLRLDKNPVSDLSPLGELPSLELLNLRNTKVADLSPLAGVLSLTHLALEGSPVMDLSPIQSLPNLVSVGLPDDTEWKPQEQPLPEKYAQHNR